MQKLEDEILGLIFEYGVCSYDQAYADVQNQYDRGQKHQETLDALATQIREKIHDLVLQVDHSNLVVEAAKEKIEDLSKVEVQAEPVAEVVLTVKPPNAPDAWLPHKIIYASLAWFDANPVGTKIYTAPQAQPADALDAKRYRWLRNGNAYVPEEEYVRGGEELDFLCDKMIGLGK